MVEAALKELPTSCPSWIPAPVVRAHPHGEKVLIKNPAGAAIHQERWVAVPFLDAEWRATILNSCAWREFRPCAVLFGPGCDRLFRRVFRLRNWREPIFVGIHGNER